nr:hypothetical protein [Tanacetum cinerariifolium]
MDYHTYIIGVLLSQKNHGKENKSTKQRKLGSPSIGRNLKVNEMLKKKNVKDEAKRKAEEKAAVKAKEEEEATKKANKGKKTYQKLKVVKENDDENVDAAAKTKEELLAELEATKKATELEATSAKDVNVDESTEVNQTDNEHDVEQTDDVDQVFNKIQTMSFLNTSTRSKKKEVDKGSTLSSFSSGGRGVLQTEDSSVESYSVAEELVTATRRLVFFVTLMRASTIKPLLLIIEDLGAKLLELRRANLALTLLYLASKSLVGLSSGRSDSLDGFLYPLGN